MELLESGSVRPRQARYQAALRPDMKCRSILRHFLQRGYLNPDREIRKGHRYASALSQPCFIRQQRHLRPGHAGFGGARLSAGGVVHTVHAVRASPA
jgi:hypothetical protein